MHRRALMAVSGVVVAVIAAALNSFSAGAGGLTNLLSSHFVSIPASMLPPAGTMYDDATCPTDTRCFVLGAGPASGLVTTTSDGGSTWTTPMLPSTTGITYFSISRPSISR